MPARPKILTGQTPLDRSYRTPTPSAIGCLIAERVARAPLHLAERTPILTAAGPLDLSADLAVLYHTLSERRQTSLHVATPSSAPPVLTRQEQDLNRVLDEIADNTEAARMRKLSINSSYRGSIGSTTDSGYVTARGRPSLSLSIESGSTPPMPGRLPDAEAQMRRKSSAASGMSSYKTPRLAVQTPLTGSTVPTVLETPTSQHSHSTKVAVPSSPLVPSSPVSPTVKSPILGATNTFRNKLSASASWRWLSFGGAASVATEKQTHVPVNPHEIARPTKLDLNGTSKTVMGNDPARNDTSPGSSRTRVTIQPNTSTPISAHKHAAGSPSPSPSPSSVRKARSASAAPSRHARSGSLSLPASPALPREGSYTSSRSGSSHHSTTFNGASAVAARSAATSLAYRQHSYPFSGDQARPAIQHAHYSGRDRSPAYAREPQTQYSSPPFRDYHSPATAPSTATTPSFPSLPHSQSQTSSSVSSNQSQTSRGTGVGVSAAPKQRLAIAPSALMRAAEMEDLLKVKPRRPDRDRDRPATANLSSKGLEAELGEVVERRGGRLKRSGTLGGSSRSAR